MGPSQVAVQLQPEGVLGTHRWPYTNTIVHLHSEQVIRRHPQPHLYQKPLSRRAQRHLPALQRGCGVPGL